MNNIELHTTITVRTFDAPATIAIGRQAPEWLAVARLAKDFGGEIHSHHVTTELLGGLHPVIGRRVIERSVALGLLEQSEPERKEGIARLSALGEEALVLGQVFIPQEGTWRFYYAEHALLSQSLLHIERLDEGNAKEERDELRKQKQQRNISTGHKTWPDCLTQAQNSAQVLSSVADGGPSFVLKESSAAGVDFDDQTLSLSLRWNPKTQPELFLNGQLTGPIRRTREKGEKNQSSPASREVDHRLNLPYALNGVSHEQVWMALAAYGANLEVADLEAWLRRAGRLLLPISFAKCGAAARNSFKQDLNVPRIPRGQFPDMKWLEGFDASTLANTELVPADEVDAQAWAKWLLNESIKEYATPERLENLADKTRDRFNFHNPSLPNPQTMLDEALAKPADAKSRFILAPYDLGLWS